MVNETCLYTFRGSQPFESTVKIAREKNYALALNGSTDRYKKYVQPQKERPAKNRKVS